MQFDIVIDSGSTWPTKGAVKRWLDAYCPSEEMRVRIRVRETARLRVDETERESDWFAGVDED